MHRDNVKGEVFIEARRQGQNDQWDPRVMRNTEEDGGPEEDGSHCGYCHRMGEQSREVAGYQVLQRELLGRAPGQERARVNQKVHGSEGPELTMSLIGGLKVRGYNFFYGILI